MLSFLMPSKRADTDGWTGGGWYRSSMKTQAGTVVDEDTALTYGAVWCATRVVSEGESCLPLLTYERDKDGEGRSEARTLPVYDLLARRPNDLMGSTTFREGRTVHQLNYGNGFAEIERDPLTLAPMALWPIHPGRVRPKRAGDRYSNGQEVPDGSYLVRNNGGSEIAIAAEDMLHIPGCHSEDGIWGKGTVTYARECVGFGLAGERASATGLGSGNTPRVVLIDPDLRDREQRRQFRSDWKDMHGSPDSGEIAIIWHRDAKLEPLSFSARDSQFLESRTFNKKEIATWYRVPLHMLMEPGSAGSTIESMGMEFVIYSLYPWCKRWEEQCDLKLFWKGLKGKYYVQHDFRGLLRGDIQSRMNAYRVALTSGIYSINDCLRLEGMPGIGPDGDEHYFPANMVTVKQLAAGLVPQQPMGPPRGPGSDHSGAPADNPTDHEPGGIDAERAFGGFIKRLTNLDRGDLTRRLEKMEGTLKADRRAAMAPVPDPAPARDAARSNLAAVLGRLIVKECNAAERAIDGKADFDAWLAEFYQKHEALTVEALTPACTVAVCAGLTVDPGKLAAKLCGESKAALLNAYNTLSPAKFKEMLKGWRETRADTVARECCGGPGSGVPGPCPEGKSDDEKARDKEDADLEAERQDAQDKYYEANKDRYDKEDKEAEDRHADESKGMQDRHANEDKATDGKRDKEDKAREKQRDKEAEPKQDARDKEDADLQDARDKEDENLTDAEIEAKDAERQKEDAKTDAQRQKEDDARDAEHAKEDKDIKDARKEDDKQTQRERDKEERSMNRRHDKEDEAREEKRQKEEERDVHAKFDKIQRDRDKSRAKEDQKKTDGKGALAVVPRQMTADFLKRNACGGPGSGVPGPCPDPTTQDQPKDDTPKEPAKEEEDGRTPEEKERDDIDSKRDDEDSARTDERDAEDNDLSDARDKEDEVTQEARDKEDKADTDKREQAEKELTAARDKEDKDREDKIAAIEKGREEEDAKLADEEKAIDEARDAKDKADVAKDNAEDARLQESRDSEDGDRSDERDSQDGAIQDARDKEDADLDARDASDDEREAVDAKREEHDTQLQDRRDTEDGDREQERQDEDDHITDQREERDTADLDAREKEDDARSAAADKLDAKREREDAMIEKIGEKIEQQREKEDKKIEKDIDDEDEAVQKDRDKEDKVREQKREKEDKELEKKRDKEDKDRQREREKEDREFAKKWKGGRDSKSAATFLSRKMMMDTIQKQACGGPGSGVPGPCPENKPDAPKGDDKEKAPADEKSDRTPKDRVKDMLDNDKDGDEAVKGYLAATEKSEALKAEAAGHWKESNRLLDEFVGLNGDAAKEAAWKEKNAGEYHSQRDAAERKDAEALKMANESLGKALDIKDPAEVIHKDIDLRNDVQKGAAESARAWLSGKIDKSVMGDRAKMETLSLPKDAEQRDYYNHGLIHLSRATNDSTVVHEFGHHINEQPHVKELAQAFHEHRFGDEKPKAMTAVCRSCGYEKGEKGVKDDMDKVFDKQQAYYTGKKYDDGQTELVSMGLEKMHRDPAGFAKKDPEYFKFMRHVLRGGKLS